MSLADVLPPALDLPPHLSAHKYFLVCTLTVATWDTLVLSPRTWRLMKTPGWPMLKVLFNFLRVFMPVEFIVVAVAFFDTKWSQETCQQFYLFEPICTAVLLAATSAIHVIRIHAIYEKNKTILYSLGFLYAVQVFVTGVSSGFYKSVPLKDGQGCIAGPKQVWVGIYWIAPTLLYTLSFVLAVMRSIKSLNIKPLTPWKLMLRDGLNLYGAIFFVNLTNVIYWFVIRPTGESDPVRTIVTSMAAVLTTSMSLRIVLSVRGSLAEGGTFGLSASTNTGSSRGMHAISTRTGAIPTNISAHHNPHTYTLDEMRSKPETDWVVDGKSSVNEAESKDTGLSGDSERAPPVGVKVTIDREIDYDHFHHAK